jgi:transcriptional regulator
MYLPRHFNMPEHAQALMREHPLAQLVSVDPAGHPFVTPLPLKLELRGEQPWLLGHVAKGNPHGALLAARPEALACFMGPQGYLSPRIYPDLQRVPTWNYLTVQARVRAHMLAGEAAKDSLLKQLIADHDPAYADQWRALPEDYTHKMLAGITAFELEVLALDCKVKLNQHRPESHAALHAAYAQGHEQERQLAQWMQRLGLV